MFKSCKGNSQCEFYAILFWVTITLLWLFMITLNIMNIWACRRRNRVLSEIIGNLERQAERRPIRTSNQRSYATADAADADCEILRYNESDK